MKFIKITAAAALVAASFAASAMSSINDEGLAAVSGQDGVTIAANLNINIGDFTYANKTGGSVSFNAIKVTGLIGMTVDVLTSAQAIGEISAPKVAGQLYWGASANTIAGLTAAIGSSDVVQFAFPNIGADSADAVSVSVDSIKMGHSTASFGSVAINHIDMQGTSVMMWAH